MRSPKAAQQHALEGRELRRTVVELAVVLVDHDRQVGHLGAAAACIRLRATHGRVAVEVEFAVVEVGHLRQALAQGIEAQQVGIERAHADGQAVDALLQAYPDLGQLGALLGDLGRAACARAARHAHLDARDEDAREEREHEDAHQGQGDRVGQVQVPRAALPA